MRLVTVPFLVSLVGFCCSNVDASLHLQCYGDTTVDISGPLYPSFHWNQSFALPSNSAVKILSLTPSRTLFDYCNLTKLNNDDMQPLFNYYNITETDQFVLLHDSDPARYSDCQSLETIVDLLWSQRLIKWLQNIKGLAYIADCNKHAGYPLSAFQPLVGTSFSHITVDGVKISTQIAGGTISIQTCLNIENIDSNGMLATCHVTEFTGDDNPMSVVAHPAGGNRFISLLLFVLIVALIYYEIKLAHAILEDRKKGTGTFALVIIFDTIANVVRLVALYDPLAVCGLSNLLVSTAFFYVQLPLSILSSCAVVFAWMRSTYALQGELRLVRRTTWMHSPLFQIPCYIFLSGLTCLDLTVSTLNDYYGILLDDISATSRVIYLVLASFWIMLCMYTALYILRIKSEVEERLRSARTKMKRNTVSPDPSGSTLLMGKMYPVGSSRALFLNSNKGGAQPKSPATQFSRKDSKMGHDAQRIETQHATIISHTGLESGKLSSYQTHRLAIIRKAWKMLLVYIALSMASLVTFICILRDYHLYGPLQFIVLVLGFQIMLVGSTYVNVVMIGFLSQ